MTNSLEFVTIYLKFNTVNITKRFFLKCINSMGMFFIVIHDCELLPGAMMADILVV